MNPISNLEPNTHIQSHILTVLWETLANHSLVNRGGKREEELVCAWGERKNQWQQHHHYLSFSVIHPQSLGQNYFKYISRWFPTPWKNGRRTENALICPGDVGSRVTLSNTRPTGELSGNLFFVGGIILIIPGVITGVDFNKTRKWWQKLKREN